MPHPCRSSVGTAAVSSRMRWEAAGNWSKEPNANQDHAGTAAKQRSSLCPAVAPGDSSSRTGHPAPCCSCCIQQGGVLGLVLLAVPRKATPPCQTTSPLGLVRLESHPTLNSWLVPSSIPGTGGSRPTQGQVGTPMAAHPRSTPTSWFVPPGLPPFGPGDCRAQLTPLWCQREPSQPMPEQSFKAKENPLLLVQHPQPRPCLHCPCCGSVTFWPQSPRSAATTPVPGTCLCNPGQQRAGLSRCPLIFPVSDSSPEGVLLVVSPLTISSSRMTIT